MSNRNFDNRVIIQRLQNQTYSRNLYINNTNISCFREILQGLHTM